MLGLSGEEVVAGGTEALEDLDVHLLGCEAYGFPLGLQVYDFLGVPLPVGAALVFFGGDGLYLLAESGLAG